jgi:NAD+ synthase (glutamine-hydrolysing)
VRIALAQVNPVVGALAANALAMQHLRARAEAEHCDLVVFPELALTGYPPEDLLLREGFLRAAQGELDTLVRTTTTTAIAVGAPVLAVDADELAPVQDARDVRGVRGPRRVGAVANALVVASDGRVQTVATKRQLPNYDVFDERRYFRPGAGAMAVATIKDVCVGFLVCEDVWVANGPAKAVADAGAQLVVVANASPYARGRQQDREHVVGERAREIGRPIVYVNAVGGQDELVFDGQSFCVDRDGVVVARAAAFAEEMLIVEFDGTTLSAPTPVAPMAPLDEVYAALVTGTRDYARKNGFRRAVIALSGGIDSSLVAVIAADALGPSCVSGFGMPSRYSSGGSVDDARELASRLGVAFALLPIEGPHVALANALVPALAHEPVALTDENLQSRIRGVLLMAISNDTGALVLTTGNKSEMATGYSTLYGDSAGGFAVIKDVNKTLVYELCRWRNECALRDGQLGPIPDDVLSKPPSAELRPDQRDDQSLPPYDELDPLLEMYVEGDATADELVAMGHDAALVARIVDLVDRSEYKRRQMPPGVRITSKAFGRDRRMPITNAFRSS